MKATIKIIQPENIGTAFGPTTAFRIDLGPGNGVGIVFAFEAEHAQNVSPVQLVTLGNTLGSISHPAQAMLVVVPPGAKFKVIRVEVARRDHKKKRPRRVH